MISSLFQVTSFLFGVVFLFILIFPVVGWGPLFIDHYEVSFGTSFVPDSAYNYNLKIYGICGFIESLIGLVVIGHFFAYHQLKGGLKVCIPCEEEE